MIEPPIHRIRDHYRPERPPTEGWPDCLCRHRRPLLAATLAQRLRCPGLTILFEGGVIGAFVEPGKLPPSTNDQRCTKRANMVLGSAEVLLLLQRAMLNRFHGRRPDRPIRQSQLVVYRRFRQNRKRGFRHRRRKRHFQPDQHDRCDEARKAPLC